ncbi:MAG: UDP-glucose/GDP-mannose dehydrogenase family protein [Myxococcota bacterium]
MNICVVGTGYVGLVVGVCMADLGFDVTCVDNNEDKIAALNDGQVPIYEPGLEPIMNRNVREGRLSFTLDGPSAVAGADVIYIAVGTPGLEDGSADLSGVLAVSELIGKHATRDIIAIIKSTVPVGTSDRVRDRIGQFIQHDFEVVSNPEFLKEGAAIKDFTHPDRIIVGCRTEKARETIRRLYQGLVRTGRPIHFMDNRSAELTKYAANAMLATRISFMNELSQLCERVGADIEAIRRGVGSDTRIGPRFLFAGVGYGGSCFPKDVAALIKTAQANDIQLSISEATVEANQRQKAVLAQKVVRHFGADLRGKTFAVWGLAFKPQTDDMREAPSVVIINALLKHGAEVVAYDPEARETAHEILGDAITYVERPMDALDGCDAMLLVTEWSEFRNPRWSAVKARMRGDVIFDGRNIFDADQVREHGFTYFGIGRQ